LKLQSQWRGGHSSQRLRRLWAKTLVDSIRNIDSAIIATHSNADPDAIGSLIVVGRTLREYGVKACHYVPEGPSRISKEILDSLGIGLEICHDIERDTLVIVVDSSNPSQLGELGGKLTSRTVILIDHHEPGRLMDLARVVIVDRQAASTSEIVGVIAGELNVYLDPAEASAGLTGIVYDTRRFRILGDYTFEAAAYYVSHGGRIIEVQVEEIEFSERYARVKAASRARVSRVCQDIVLVVTHVGSYESSAARALLEIGADIAVVVGGSGSAKRISVRVSRRAADSGVYADVLARYIAEKLGGEGGGHRQVAMVHLPPGAGEPSNIADLLAKSIQGKAARLCTQGRYRVNG